jgi:hypothetical protein
VAIRKLDFQIGKPPFNREGKEPMPTTSNFIALSVALVAVSMLSTEPSVALPVGHGAKGDACTVHTNVPGKDNGDGECCSNTDPKDCVIILKPFPTNASKANKR